MRLLFVVQRYGTEVVGGSERACREMALHMAKSGHVVEILTTCAIDHLSWANEYPPGRGLVDELTVHRLEVDEPRDLDKFLDLTAHLLGEGDVEPAFERQWLAAQGPSVPELPAWLADNATRFDVVVFFTYLYETTTAGILPAAARTATLVHPTAHDERYLRLRHISHVFHHADALAYFTPEEQDLVTAYHAPSGEGRVIGIGFDPPALADGEQFRRQFGIHDPFILYLGRVETGKGIDELLRDVRACHERRGDAPRLVLVGHIGMPLPEEPWLTVLGPVTDAARADALRASLAVVQPSHFESFSLVVVEAWLQGRPAVVQRRSSVLSGQIARSGGGLVYDGPAEFADAIARLIDTPGLGERLGAAGRRYAEQNFGWDLVARRYESLLYAAVARHAARRHRIDASGALEKRRLRMFPEVDERDRRSQE